MSHEFTFEKQPERRESNHELLEEGWHSFEIVNAYSEGIDGKPLESKAGIPYFKIICREPESEVVVWHFLFLDPERARRVSAFLFAIGYDFTDGQTISLAPSDFVGQWFRGRVEEVAGTDGIKRNKITRVEPSEETNDDPLGAAEPCPPAKDDEGEPPPVTKEEEDEIPF